jgi:hypothetical protein
MTMKEVKEALKDGLEMNPDMQIVLKSKAISKLLQIAKEYIRITTQLEAFFTKYQYKKYFVPKSTVVRVKDVKNFIEGKEGY